MKLCKLYIFKGNSEILTLLNNVHFEINTTSEAKSLPISYKVALLLLIVRAFVKEYECCNNT